VNSKLEGKEAWAELYRDGRVGAQRIRPGNARRLDNQTTSTLMKWHKLGWGSWSHGAWFLSETLPIALHRLPVWVPQSGLVGAYVLAGENCEPLKRFTRVFTVQYGCAKDPLDFPALEATTVNSDPS